ncbi:hypothetical protein [Polyangium aurulentum]|uniref:hypothetical protein n=1 Tax=Polyangium aurulentum TaxID=2567896 RepID=UPI0010AE8C2D|nr:hypothetical protein [Polyangium aurulentum]UQA57963.1 hypothetical protein E8A73_042960 [Polyangium aurulentum]
MTSFAKSALCLLAASPLVAAAFVSGCSSDPNNPSGGTSTQSSGSASTGSAGGGTGGAGGSGGAGSGAGSTGVGGAPTAIAECQGHVYACGDLVDNDSDGLLDSQDPDCLGPCDNTESSYYGGIPGQGGPDCYVDCYWDSNSGSGDDGCYWNHRCDPLSVDPNWYPETWNGSQCAYDMNANTPGTNLGCDELLNNQPATCLNVCPDLTPNGCDCFGCCELPAGSGSFVWLGSEDGNGNGSCSIKDLADPSKCAPCTPVKGACFNGCGKCELCIGKDTLPPECTQGGTGGAGGGAGGAGGSPGEQCPGGEQPCGLTGQAPCEPGFYCITGCCIEQPK